MDEMTEREKRLFAYLKKRAGLYEELLKEIEEKYYLRDHHKAVDDIARILGAIASPDKWTDDSIEFWFRD